MPGMPGKGDSVLDMAEPQGPSKQSFKPCTGGSAPFRGPRAGSEAGAWGDTVSPLQTLTHLAPPGVFPALFLRKG